ncbi:MAG: sulfite exporter TauE/SafE family protein [Bryobacteraceae bacterium]
MTGLWAALWMAFSLGLMASLHCAQMCGPIVLAYSMHTPKWRAHFAYNAGRILTYSALGAVAGGLGGAAAIAGAGRWVGMATGVLMIVVGLMMTGYVPSAGGLVTIGATDTNLLTRLAGPLVRSSRALEKFGLGVCLGFLPCGMIWAALLQAAGAGSAWEGAAMMAAFGCGTAGSLLATAAFAPPLRAMLTGWLGRHSSRIGGIGIMAAGAWVIWRAWMVAAQGAACHVHGA